MDSTESDDKNFIKIGSMMQIAKCLQKDPKKAIELIMTNRSLYSWISDSELKTIINSLDLKSYQETKSESNLKS